MTISALLLLASSPAIAAAQSNIPACRLPNGLWARRQALQKEFDRSNGQSDSAYQAIQQIHARYRSFLVVVAGAYATNQTAVVNSCCDAVKDDVEASIFCGLVRYVEDGRKRPDRFLAVLPETPDGVAALVDLDSAAEQSDDSSSLASAPVLNVTNEIYRLILADNAVATAKYFWLFRHSGGAYADDVADQLEDLLTNHPDTVIRDWPVLRKHWDLSDGITWDVDAGWWQAVIKGFRAKCRASGPRCSEILSLLEKAARAAGAPPQ